MKNEVKKPDAKPVQISDLIAEDKVLEFQKVDQLRAILNNPVPESWVKKHPFIKDHNYLPIDKVEYLLDRIFKRYRIEVIKTGMLMNSVEVTVRLHFVDPVTGQWDFHDGVGAAEIQTVKDSGSLKLDMSNVNRGAIPMALPIAKTYAIKDAADHIGRIFGRDLNRKETVAYKVDDTLAARAERYSNLLIDKNDENETSND